MGNTKVKKMPDYYIHLLNKDGVTLGIVNLGKYLVDTGEFELIRMIEPLGNRSLMVDYDYKLKGVGVIRYDGHYGAHTYWTYGY